MDLSQFNNGAGYDPVASTNEKEGFTPIPPGIYQCKASFVEVRDNYDRDGKDLEITLDIMGPTHAGRKIFKKIKQTGAAVKPETRTKQMGNLAAALRLTTKLESTDQISGAQFDAKVTIYNDKNYAHDLFPLGSQEPTQATPAPAAPVAASTAQPWTPAAQPADAPF